MSKISSGNWFDMPWKPIRAGLSQVVFAMEADGVSLAIAKIENGHEVKPHSHPNEQIALCLAGACDYYVDGVPHKMVNGSWVVVPPNVEHYVHVYETHEPCLQLDVFSPNRPEYTEAYEKFLADNGITR